MLSRDLELLAKMMTTTCYKQKNYLFFFLSLSLFPPICLPDNVYPFFFIRFFLEQFSRLCYFGSCPDFCCAGLYSRRLRTYGRETFIEEEEIENQLRKNKTKHETYPPLFHINRVLYRLHWKKKLIYGFITRKYKKKEFFLTIEIYIRAASYYFFFSLQLLVVTCYVPFNHEETGTAMNQKDVEGIWISRCSVHETPPELDADIMMMVHAAMRLDDRWRQVMEPITGPGVKTTTILYFPWKKKFSIFLLHWIRHEWYVSYSPHYFLAPLAPIFP